MESILPKCGARLLPAGEEGPIDHAETRREADELAAKGLRVLALARKNLPPETRAIGHDDVADGLIFLGLQGMIDPPRPEAAQAVATCQRAGIQVKMITGDHAKTAGGDRPGLKIDGVDAADGTEEHRHRPAGLPPSADEE